MLNKIYIAILFMALLSCSKMEDYLKYTDGVENVYPGKIDSLVAYSGRDRVQLEGLMSADPTVKLLKVYWNNRKDSLLVDVSGYVKGDWFVKTIDNLEEMPHTFQLVTEDQLGNESVPSSVRGRSYGDKYEATLLNRAVKMAELNSAGQVLIDWGIKEENAISIKIKYQDTADDEKTIIVSADQISTLLANYKSGTQFAYQTMFKPDTNTIDFFYAPQKYQNVSQMLEKDRFRDVNFVGDTPPTNVDNGLKERLWDGKWSTNINDPYNPTGWRSYSVKNTNKDPIVVISLDLGVTAKLDKFRLNHYWALDNYAPKEYEIWGSTEFDNDGSWIGWIKLGGFKHADSMTPAIKAELYSNGDLINIPNNMPPIRYIRFRGIRNFTPDSANQGEMAMSEFTFWGTVLEMH